MSPPSRIELARKQIEFARGYTRTLIDDLSDDLWFTTPPANNAQPVGGAGSVANNCVTHIAWQVGHLAMAEYGLCLFRIRGRQSEDTKLMSSSFRKKFSRGTAPDPDPDNNPPPAEIRDVFDRVHCQVLSEIGTFSDDILDEPVDEPYAAFATKFGALLFCPHHEMIHAGQIGLLRRLMGREPVR